MYDLPEELIAQSPLESRDQCRLLVLDKESGTISHQSFYEVIDYLNEGDCLIINDTKVLCARLFGSKKDSGGKIEVLLLKRLENNQWECLVKPGRKARVGQEIIFGDGRLSAVVKDIVEEGNRIIEFQFEGIFEEILDELGQMPLPPYITERLEDKNMYQTVYAKEEGSAAAPTAGLHFTDELLRKIKEKGIVIAPVTLHVGLGTFRPVKVEDVSKHHMHAEYYDISEESADKIRTAKSSGKKVICVGTTSVRTIEAAMQKMDRIGKSSGWTEIFIYPGFEFKLVDALITNFHLPGSTLMMLVSALSDREKILMAYEEAIREKYRFFSFGDAMLIK